MELEITDMYAFKLTAQESERDLVVAFGTPSKSTRPPAEKNKEPPEGKPPENSMPPEPTMGK